MTKAQKLKGTTQNVVKTVDSKDPQVEILYLGSIPPDFQVISEIKTGEARLSRAMKKILKKAIGGAIKGDIYFEQYPHFKGKETSTGEVGWCLRIQERRLGYVWCQFLACLEGVVNYESGVVEDYIRIYEFYDPKEFNFYRLTKDEKLFFGEAENELKSLRLYISRGERMKRKIAALVKYRANREIRIEEKLDISINRVLARSDENLRNIGAEPPAENSDSLKTNRKNLQKKGMEAPKKSVLKKKEKILEADDDIEDDFDDDFDDDFGEIELKSSTPKKKPVSKNEAKDLSGKKGNPSRKIQESMKKKN